MATYVFLGTALSHTLDDGTYIGERIGLKDTIGDAETNPRTIYGLIDGGSSIVMDQNYQALEFVWNGQTWSVF